MAAPPLPVAPPGLLLLSCRSSPSILHSISRSSHSHNTCTTQYSREAVRSRGTAREKDIGERSMILQNPLDPRRFVNYEESESEIRSWLHTDATKSKADFIRCYASQVNNREKARSRLRHWSFSRYTSNLNFAKWFILLIAMIYVTNERSIRNCAALSTAPVSRSGDSSSTSHLQIGNGGSTRTRIGAFSRSNWREMDLIARTRLIQTALDFMKKSH